MKPVIHTLAAGLTTCLLIMFSSNEVYAQQLAQQGATTPASDVLRIRSLTGLGRDFEQRAIGLGTRSAKPKTWGVFDVVFDTNPEWIDELTISYFLMFYNVAPKQGEKPMSLMRLNVEYSDIAQGRDHRAGVVVSPAGLIRYGKPIGFAVQILLDGKVIAEQGVVDGELRGKDKWWASPQIIDNPVVQKRDGYLIERSKSVFGLVDLDNYEVGK